MKVYTLCVEKTVSTSVEVKAPDEATAREWLEDNLMEVEDQLDFKDYDADFAVGRAHYSIDYNEELHTDVLEVSLDWLKNNGYEVVISVKRKEPV